MAGLAQQLGRGLKLFRMFGAVESMASRTQPQLCRDVLMLAIQQWSVTSRAQFTTGCRKLECMLNRVGCGMANNATLPLVCHEVVVALGRNIRMT